VSLSIRVVLTSVLVALLLLATTTVGLAAWMSTSAVLEDSWLRTADSLADQASAATAVFLSGAEPAVRFSELQADRDALDVTDYDSVLEHEVRVLKANQAFTWYSWSDEQGTLASALWWPTDDGLELVKELRIRVDGQSWQRQWREEAGQWVLMSEAWIDYDPRQRPYYKAAKALADGGAWVDPYLYVSRQQPGVSFVLPSRDAQGALRGVWSSDFECGPLSEYLASLKVGRTGRVYLLHPGGAVVGHPEGVVAASNDVHRAATHPDPWLRAAWTAYQARGGRPGAFDVGELLAAAKPFPDESNIPWTVLVVVPKAELYDAAHAHVERAAAVSAVLVLLAVALGLWFSRHLAGAVATVEQQMERIARFEFTDVALADQGSWIREVNEMSGAHDRMKQGLKSFARYVPHQLVEQMMRSGQGAQLGGEEREITVLFCDIAGFTTMTEATDPQIIFAGLTDYFTQMNEAIAAEGGTVVQYLGDAVMAVWGAPAERADHAEAAVAAAIRMAAISEQLVHSAKERGLPPLPSRIGVHTGPCLVGNVGAEERFSYAVVGEGVRTAERVEGRNKLHGTSLLISAATASRVAGRFAIESVDGDPTVFRVAELS
jgi:adenylate cyclase